MDEDSPTTIAIRAIRAETLRDARDALYRGEGPDLYQDADIVYGEWLSNRACQIEAAS